MHQAHCLLLLLSVRFSASGADLPRELGRLLHDLPNAQAVVGACVVRLPGGEEVFALNADNPLIPASCQKVIAAAVALDVLGADFAFETRLARRGSSLVLVGGGDPGLGDPRLAEARGEDPLAVLRRFAAAVSPGAAQAQPAEVLVDDSVFEAAHVHPSWEPDDLPKWFAVPVGGLNFNDNCIDVTLSPTRPGRPVEYQIFPPNDWVHMENRCKTGGGRKPWIHRNPASLIYELRGECDRREVLQSVSVPDPGLFTGEVFRAVLRSHGIAIAAPASRVVSNDLPDLEILAAHRTPIGDLLVRALRDSQNLFAESLIKAAVHEDSVRRGAAEPGSWSRATQLVADRLNSWGCDIGGLVFADGSGLSRDNRVTARQLAGVLAHVYAHLPREAGDRFIASMSEAGKSGTLHKRMRHLPGRVYGKTGYLVGVRSLCGFVAPEGQRSWYAFAIVFNGISGGTQPYNDIHDQVCRLLAEP